MTPVRTASPSFAEPMRAGQPSSCGDAAARRIVHVVNSLDVGGTERLVLALASAQVRDGHRVHVHCLSAPGPISEELKRLQVSVSTCEAPSRAARIRSLVTTFRTQSPVVVHCHNAGPTMLAAPLARVFGSRCVIATRHGGARFDGDRLHEAKFALAARACSHVVAVSESTARMLAGSPFASRRLVTILNGAPAPAIPSRPREEDDRVVLVCVARLSWSKDHATLLRAIARLRATVPALELWLVGDGPDRSALERLAADLDVSEQVHFIGTQRDIGMWLAQADLFVLSSISEGAPLALMEALSAGLTPIATAAGGVPEIIARSGVGCVVPLRDDVALADAIVRAIAERHHWPEWRRQARIAYEQHFTVARMCDEYERLIARTLNGPGARARR